MPIKYGPCDRCGGIIKPCRCTLLAERDALAERVRGHEEGLRKIEFLYQECRQAQAKSNNSWVASVADCPLDDGTCAECNYFEAYARYLRSHPPQPGKEE